jgi:hypothetical protein
VVEYQIQDSSKTIVAYDSLKGRVLTANSDSLIITDSLQAIKLLLTAFSSLMEQNQKNSEKLYATEDILNYVNTMGFVLNKNRVKFNKAVSAYFKLAGWRGRYHQMQKLDILTRDLKGNATGWIKQ